MCIYMDKSSENKILHDLILYRNFCKFKYYIEQLLFDDTGNFLGYLGEVKTELKNVFFRLFQVRVPERIEYQEGQNRLFFLGPMQPLPSYG